MDPPFEVAVAAEHRGDDQVVLGDRVRDLLAERAAVADARRAAVADEVEPELVEIRRQTGFEQVVGDDFRAGRERRLHPRRGFEAFLDGLLRQQPRADHQRRVRGVRARRDRRDHDRAVRDLRARVRRDGRSAALALEALDLLRAAVARALPLLERDGQRHAVLRAARAREVRHDVAEVQRQRVGEARLGRVVGAEHALRLRVRFDQIDLLLRAPGEPQVLQRQLVDREDRDGRAVLRRHVADDGAVGDRQLREAGAVELHELPDDALLAQHLRDREREVGRGDAFVHLPGDLEADHVGDQHRHRLAEHRGFGLDPADAPGQHAQAVRHRRVRVGADDGVGVCERRAAGMRFARAAGAEHDAREILDVHLVHDPGVGRHRAKAVQRGLSPLQERVALAVAVELELRVLLERVGRGPGVDLHRVIDHELDRLQRAAELRDRVAHRGEVDHARHAGEVLQQHARGPVGDLLRRARARVPRRQRLDVGLRHRPAVLEPQQVLEQDLQRVRQRPEVVRLAERREPEVRVFPIAGAERVARGEAVRMRVRHGFDSVRRTAVAPLPPAVPYLLTAVPFCRTVSMCDATTCGPPSSAPPRATGC